MRFAVFWSISVRFSDPPLRPPHTASPFPCVSTKTMLVGVSANRQCVYHQMGTTVTVSHSDRGRDTRETTTRLVSRREIFSRDGDDFGRSPRREFANDARGSPRRDFADDARRSPRRQQTETVRTTSFAITRYSYTTLSFNSARLLLSFY